MTVDKFLEFVESLKENFDIVIYFFYNIIILSMNKFFFRTKSRKRGILISISKIYAQIKVILFLSLENFYNFEIFFHNNFTLIIRAASTNTRICK